MNPDPRINSLYFFNVGSHALIQDATHIYEVPSIHVTTDDDIIDIYDGKISLREAIYYAANGITSTITGLENTYTVTFDDDLANNENGQTNTITLSDTYQEMRITKGLHTRQLSINANYNNAGEEVGESRIINIKVANVGTTGYRIFQAGSSYDSHSTWKIDLQNLNISGGSITAHSTYQPWDQEGHGGILYVKGAINTISLTYVTMQCAKSTGSGAAIYSNASNSSTITLTTSTIKDNSSQSSGGAIYNLASQNATITLQENSVLTNNTAKVTGAGIYNRSVTSTVTIRDSEISNNVVSSDSNNVYGGGVYNYGSTIATVNLDHAEIKGNQATVTAGSSNAYGGGIYNASPVNGIVNFTNDTILSSNKALVVEGEAHGGAIANYVYGSSTTSTGIITGFDSLIKDNEATTNGGGLYNYVYNNAYGASSNTVEQYH